ncbi:polysaccharide pyruvyl transferase family protein [Cyanobium sp. FACHB-13342]|uniref:polysaccharide pyruvyl transferase family protein n=1 Tax=Cyanobium sp. FACHB-13342 TaxID=2692793 RepID=UPI001680FBEE|nr:polysaccharide pyruvyl transferase family protein [Cyanobium sp. FACHB-13342]MBD2422483.1 polysaccharide pyruvyl transferase family protein [Cyanobium sp. FACHB-13342]
MYTIANIRPLGYNVGNHAIHFALRHMLYETFGRLVSIIDYPATSKHECTTKAGLTPATVHEINRFADGVIVGGGNLYENDEIAVDARALAALKPPLMLFSNSRGRIYDRHGQLSDRSDVIPDAKLTALLRRADISMSRDSATQGYLQCIDARELIGWCPTINMNRYANNLPELPENEDVGALISVRTPQLMNVPYRYQSRIQSHIESAIDALRSAGHKRIRILCNDSRDLDFATAFRYTKQVDSVYTNDVYQYLALLRAAQMVVSYRLHASLPAISFGTPTVNIVYDERADSLFDDLGLTSARLNLVELGDRFVESLTKSISLGGYGPQQHAQLKTDWQAKTDIQFDHMTNFKRLMENYLKTGLRS